MKRLVCPAMILTCPACSSKSLARADEAATLLSTSKRFLGWQNQVGDMLPRGESPGGPCCKLMWNTSYKKEKKKLTGNPMDLWKIPQAVSKGIPCSQKVQWLAEALPKYPFYSSMECLLEFLWMVTSNPASPFRNPVPTFKFATTLQLP